MDNGIHGGVEVMLDIYGTKYTCKSYNSHQIFSVGEWDNDDMNLNECIGKMSSKLVELFMKNKSAVVIVAEGLDKAED